MEIVDILLHLDSHLSSIVGQFGLLTYVIIFLVIFAETGLVVTPFLPGDSLLFTVGILSATGLLNIWIIYPSLFIAVIAGDSSNYWIGHHLGPKIFKRKNSGMFNRTYLDKTERFYEKHGGKTIIMARFLPVLRTFTPFVAGAGRMHYVTFLTYNVLGAFIWVTFFVSVGYIFGGSKIVKENIELAVAGVIAFMLILILTKLVRSSKKLRRTKEKHATYKDLEKTFKKEHLSD
jgi:membrane-associated protein